MDFGPQEMVGKKARWDPPDERDVIDAVCTAWRYSGTVVENERGLWRGVQYEMETPDGKREWTCTFPDESVKATLVKLEEEDGDRD